MRIGPGFIRGSRVDETDYYRILQVSTSATQEEIKTSYKRLALAYHPDRSDDPRANELMTQLNEAYEVLRDAEKRAEYDARRLFPAVVVPAVREDSDERTRPIRVRPDPAATSRLKSWMKDKLSIIFRIFLAMNLLFAWSLATGQLNLVLVLLLVILTLSVVVLMVVKIRQFIQETQSSSGCPPDC